MRIPRPLCVLLFAVPALGQSVPLETWLKAEAGDVPPSAPTAMATIDRADLARYTFHLASDDFGGRHTGTPGQEKAAKFIADHFAGLGLEPLGDEVEGERGFLQSYTVASTFLDPDELGITFDGTTFTDGFGVMPGTRTSEVDIDGEFVFCGTIKQREMPTEFEAGQIPVFIMPASASKPGRPMPSEMQFMMGFRHIRSAAGISSRAMRRGAETVLVLDLGNRLADVMQYGGLLPGKPMLSYGNEIGMDQMLRGNNPAPFVVVGKPLAEKLLAHLGVAQDPESGDFVERAEEKRAAQCRFRIESTGKFECSNVVAYLRGADAKLAGEALVFSAHMDHMGTRLDGDVFNGADDNASGTAALLEVAEAFAKGERPRRSVIFLSVSGEELGLWGSDHFASNPPWDRDDLVANINIDMIGRVTDLSGVDEISATPSPSHSKFSTLVRESARLARHFDMTLTSGDTYYERSDHYNFAKHGIPVVFFCAGEHPDYHQVTDTADKLDYAKIEKVARLAYWTGWRVCTDDDRPKKLGRSQDWVSEDG